MDVPSNTIWPAQEIALLEELAEGTWLAVERLRNEALLEQRVAERTEQLRASKRQFERSNNALGQFAGTGIGLALCRKIVTNHGGKISAEAVAGKGAPFFVILPAGEPQAH